MKLKLPRLLYSLFLLSGLAWFLGGCFGSVGVDPTEDPVQPSSNAENAAEANNSENFANEDGNNANLNEDTGNEENLENNENNFAENEDGGIEGENVNNAEGENFLNNENGGGQANMFGNDQQTGNNNLLQNNNQGKNNNLGLGNNNFGLNQGGGDDALVNGAESDVFNQESTNLNQGATDQALDEPSSDDNVLEPVNETPINSEGSIRTGGVVRYVLPGGSPLLDRPSGQTVKNLEQGDHPLVSEEGEWSRTSDGYYVPAENLTPQPIARAKTPREWR